MTIRNACRNISGAYDSGSFRLEGWRDYIDREVPGARELCERDVRECIDGGLSWENDYLPVLDAAYRETGQREKALESFRLVTDGLDERISSRFGKTLDTEIVIYLGLCNGAGWVTGLNGRTAVLLGIEKIVELGWTGTDDMYGLILHELGHVWQDRYGVLSRSLDDPGDSFLWQLFTEGVAMVFEQETVGDTGYYHQDRNGWACWCEGHLGELIRDFEADRRTMTRTDQRYFGDWASYHGRPDTGYYLGARLVRFMMRHDAFDSILNYEIGSVREAYGAFARTFERK
ncbi:MAG: hypothetical protein J5569_07290 [Oscillospiraceae bacterium]|nr:hypothetical protein [Oscillospiraceae bacterium]